MDSSCRTQAGFSGGAAGAQLWEGSVSTRAILVVEESGLSRAALEGLLPHAVLAVALAMFLLDAFKAFFYPDLT